MPLVLSSREFAAYHAKLAQRFRPAVLRGVHSGAARAVGYLVQKTREAPPANPAGIGTGGAVNTGAFLRGWKAIRLPDGAELVQTVPYGPVVEHGRRPGSKFPPKAPLIAWIKRRLLTKPKPKKPRGKPRTLTEAQRAAADRERAQKAARRFVAGRRPAAPAKAGGKRGGANIDDQAARLYFPIARAIARRGLRGRKILDRLEHRRDIIDFVRAEVARELRRELARR